MILTSDVSGPHEIQYRCDEQNLDNTVGLIVKKNGNKAKASLQFWFLKLAYVVEIGF